MAPRKRRKVSRGTAETSGSVAIAAPPADGSSGAGATASFVACTNCRMRKLRCVPLADSVACERCAKNNIADSCIKVQQPNHRRRCGNNALPVNTEVVNQDPTQRKEVIAAAQQVSSEPTQPRKRNSDLAQLADQPKPKRRRALTSAQPTNGPSSNATLVGNSDAAQLADQPEPKRRRVMTSAEPSNGPSSNVIPAEEVDEPPPPPVPPRGMTLQQAAEILDLITSMATGEEEGGSEGDHDDDGSSDSDSEWSEDDAEFFQFLEAAMWQRKYGATNPAQGPVNLKDAAPKQKVPSWNHNDETSVFNIPCAVCLPDGRSAPFKISSTITLNDLRLIVAEKLHHRYFGLIALQYWLNDDKRTFGAILIQSDAELDMFKTRMRRLLVPQRLANGQLSTPPLNAVVVFFEDIGPQSDTNDVSVINGKQLNRASSTNGQLAHYEEFVPAAHNHRRYESQPPCTQDRVHYYHPNEVPVCYPLAHNNAVYCAPQNRMATGSTPVQAIQPSTLPNVGYQQPVYVAATPWCAPGMQGGHYPYTQPIEMSASCYNVSPAHNTLSNPSIATDDIPDIVSWFAFLDRHELRNKFGIAFAPYGPMFEEKGFVRISQLSSDFLRPADLQRCLGMDIRIASLIMQYANEDLEAIKLGRWGYHSQI